MFGIGSTELAIILIFGFLLFGPDKLPQMGHTIGRALRQFRETQEKLTAVVQTEVVDPMSAAMQEPVKKPKKSGANPTGATADTDDLDADIADDAIEAPRKKETFAERRARLAAEKAEKEAASDGVAGTEEAAVAGAPSADAEPAKAEGADQKPADDKPKVRTTADLYAHRPHKKKAAPAAAEVEAPVADADTVQAPAEEGGER